MASVKWWILALAVTCALFQVKLPLRGNCAGCVQGQFLRRFRSCVLPHERRARLWERNEQYCSAGRHLEYRRRSQRCICQPGYYRDEETNNCYDARRCGQCDSSKHERFSSCTNDCESVCGKQVIQQCDKPCVPGCECMKGYIRKYKKGPCVPIQTCPPKCPAYMTFEMERERCPRVCNVAREDSCSETNEGPGCACKKGFVLRAPFGTVRTRVWCIHESMCTFPDEDKGSDTKPEVKGGQSVKGKGVTTNSFWGSNQGQHALEEPGPKNNDDLFLGGKGFPPLGDLGRKGAQALQLDQEKVDLNGGQITQGKVVPGSDNIWGWNKGQPGIEGSLPEKIDDDLFQDTKGFPPLGGLGKKKGQGENLAKEEIGVKGGQESRGTGIIENGNFWGLNKGQHKLDEELYLDVNRFSNLGDLRQTAGKGSQLIQQEVGLNRGQSDHQRQVMGSGQFWSWNKGQHRFEDSAPKQSDNDLYLGAKGFPSVGQFGLKNGEASVFNPDEIGFKGGQSGQKGGALGIENNWGSSKGGHGFQESILKDSDNNLYLGAKGFPALGNLGHKNGPTSALNPEATGLEGGSGIEAQGAATSDNTWSLNKVQPGLKQSAPEENDNLYLGNSEFPSLGNLGHTKGQGSQLLQDSFLGGKQEGSSGQWSKINRGQELLGLGGLPVEKGQNIDMDDWLSGQQGTDTVPDLNKGQEGDEGLMSSKVVEDWVPDEGQLQKGGSKKRGLPSSIKGASNIPGVGLPVGKLPDIAKLGGNLISGGIPGVGTPVGELPNIGGVNTKGMPFGGNLISQKVSTDNSPGQIEILGYGAKGAKGGPLHGGREHKTGSIDWAQQMPPEFPKATAPVPLSVPTSSSLNQQSQNTHFIGQGSQTRYTNTGQPDTVGWPKQNEPSPMLPVLQSTTASFPFSGAAVTSTNQRAESTGLPDFTGQGWQTGHGNMAQPGAVERTQQREPLSGISQFQRATAPVPFSGATFGSLSQQRESIDSTSQSAQMRQSSMAQPSGVDWTQQREPLSGISQFQSATAPVSLPGATFGSLSQQRESIDSISQSAQMHKGRMAKTSAVDWTQHNEPLSMLPAFQTSKAAVPLAGANVASINQKKENTYVTGQRSQTRQVSVGKPAVVDWMHQNGALSTQPEFQRQTASVPYSGPTFGFLNHQKQSTDFTDQRSALFSGTTFGSLNQQNTHFLGQVSQTPETSMVQPEVVDWTPQNKHLSRFPKFQTATDSVPRSGATVASIAHQNGNTDFASHVLQTRHISMTQPGGIYWTPQNEQPATVPEFQTGMASVPRSGATLASIAHQNENIDLTSQVLPTHHISMTQPGEIELVHQNEPLSSMPQLQGATASVPLSIVTVASKNQQKQKTDLTNQDSKTRHGSMTQPGAVHWTKENEPLLRLPELQRATATVPNSSATVPFKNPQKEKQNSTAEGSPTHHGRITQNGGVNRTQLNKPLSQLPELQKATTSAAISGTTVASKNQPKNLTGQDSKTRHGSMQQTGAGSIKTTESTAGVVTNQKRNTGYTIFHSGMQLDRNIFGGRPNMFSLGSSFQYSWPVVGTGQLSAGYYPNGYGVYDALGQPFYGQSGMPIGYPMFYPSSYAPMTNIWGQRMEAVDGLQTQQQRAMKSESPSSPASLSDQNTQQGEIHLAGGGAKGGGVTGVQHKIPVGNVPAEENYAFDDRSLDSW